MGDLHLNQNLKDVFIDVLNQVDLISVANIDSERISIEFKQWLQNKGFVNTGNVLHSFAFIQKCCF